MKCPANTNQAALTPVKTLPTNATTNYALHTRNSVFMCGSFVDLISPVISFYLRISYFVIVITILNECSSSDRIKSLRD
jgi:hypothetical protein